MKKCIIIIIIFLSSFSLGAQEYFFNFVDGFQNNYALEFEQNYLFLGIDGIGGSTIHWFVFNELNAQGDTINQINHQVDSLNSLSFRWRPQVADSIDSDNLFIVGNVDFDDEIKGVLVNYNLISEQFETIKFQDNIIYDNIVVLNDTTILVAGDRNYPGSANLLSTLYNMDLQGNIRWETSFNCGSLCQRWPVQILPLSNGNIAFLMDEYDADYPWDSRRAKAVLVVVDETGEVLWEEYPGYEEDFRIWAGGMVEIDGQIIVSYTDPYYYNASGEWHFHYPNTIHLEWYDDVGNLNNYKGLQQEIPADLLGNTGRYHYRVRQMQSLDDGNIFLSGTTGYGGLLLKIDSEGNVIWHREHFPHEFEENDAAAWYTHFYSATPVSDGGFILAGQYDSSPSSLYPGGIQTAIAVKVDEYGCLDEGCQVGIEEYEENLLSVFPNPSTGRFAIELPVLRLRSATYKLSIFDALGVEVFSQYNVRGEHFEIDLSGVSDGVYFVRLSAENQILTSKIIKQ